MRYRVTWRDDLLTGHDDPADDPVRWVEFDANSRSTAEQYARCHIVPYPNIEHVIEQRRPNLPEGIRE